MLSVVIVACNEADRIGVALASVAFADEVLVVDSGSIDDTVALAKASGARVVQTDWPGYVAQKNRALALATGDWILSIDADEEVSPELRGAIQGALAADRAGVHGYRMNRLNLWFGVPIRHGDWYPDRRVRLVRRGRGRWGGEDPHDALEVDGPVEGLAGDIVHRSHRSLGEQLAKVDRYSRIAAASAKAAGRRARWVDLAVRPAWSFVRGYGLRGGWRDGLPGLVIAAINALYVLLKYARLREPIP
jgi:glycosyltransferase involved in cell wall biosynthesis